MKRKTASENVEYVLDDKFVLQEADGANSSHPSFRRYHYAANPLQVTDQAGTTFLSVDALGSVADQTTTSGTVYQARQYDAWGQYRNGTAPAANQPKLGYTGHQYDVETGLVYARARYYDPETGVFLSRDVVEGSLADAPSLHRYMYVRGNPLRYMDPDGNVTTDERRIATPEEEEAAKNAPPSDVLAPLVDACKQGDTASCVPPGVVGSVEGVVGTLWNVAKGTAKSAWKALMMSAKLQGARHMPPELQRHVVSEVVKESSEGFTRTVAEVKTNARLLKQGVEHPEQVAEAMVEAGPRVRASAHRDHRDRSIVITKIERS